MSGRKGVPNMASIQQQRLRDRQQHRDSEARRKSKMCNDDDYEGGAGECEESSERDRSFLERHEEVGEEEDGEIARLLSVESDWKATGILPSFMDHTNIILKLHLNEPYVCIESVPGDGNCFFSAVLYQLPQRQLHLLPKSVHPRALGIGDPQQFRLAVLRFIRRDRNLHKNPIYLNAVRDVESVQPLEQYLLSMENQATYADHFMLYMTSLFMEKNIYWISENSQKRTPWSKWELPMNGGARPPAIRLAYLQNRAHYEPVVPIPPTPITSAAVCGRKPQSKTTKTSDAPQVCKFEAVTRVSTYI